MKTKEPLKLTARLGYCGILMIWLVAISSLLPAQTIPTIPTIRVQSDTARIGEVVRIPIIRSAFRPDSAFEMVRSARFRFAYNPSVLLFRRDLMTTQGKGRIVTEDFSPNTSDGLASLIVIAPVDRRFAAADTIAWLPFTVCLGDAMRSALSVGGPSRVFAWLDANDRPVAIFNTPTNPLIAPNASFVVSDARWYNLLNTAPGELEMDIAPNPVILGQSIMTVRYDSTNITAQARNLNLFVYNEEGQRVLDLSNLLTGGNIRRLYEVSVPLGLNYRTTLLAGRLYYCRFSVGNYTLTRLLRVQ